MRGLPGLLLVVLVLASALGVVYAKHESRRLFVELRELQAARDRMDVEWGRLQLEQSSLISHGRLEMRARQDLDMRLPAADAVVILQR